MVIVDGPHGGSRTERRIVREAVADRAWLPFSRPKARIEEREEIICICEPLTIVVAVENDAEREIMEQWLTEVHGFITTSFSRATTIKRDLVVGGLLLFGAFPIEHEVYSLKYKLSIDRCDPVPRI